MGKQKVSFIGKVTAIHINDLNNKPKEKDGTCCISLSKDLCTTNDSTIGSQPYQMLLSTIDSAPYCFIITVTEAYIKAHKQALNLP